MSNRVILSFHHRGNKFLFFIRQMMMFSCCLTRSLMNLYQRVMTAAGVVEWVACLLCTNSSLLMMRSVREMPSVVVNNFTEWQDAVICVVGVKVENMFCCQKRSSGRYMSSPYIASSLTDMSADWGMTYRNFLWLTSESEADVLLIDSLQALEQWNRDIYRGSRQEIGLLYVWAAGL